jgi:hypothetical protein
MRADLQLEEIKIKSIYGLDAKIIEEAQSQGRIRFKFHTEDFPLVHSGLRVCDICVEIEDSKEEFQNKNNVYPELLN